MLHLEEGSFVPLVFATSGGMAPEPKHFIRRLAALIATNMKEDYSQVMCNIRTRLSNEHGYNKECASSSKRCAWKGEEGTDRPYIQGYFST